MPQKEIWGERDLSYSAWHRTTSTMRFVGIEKAQLLSMIDSDVALWIEWDVGLKIPVAYIETARDVGQQHKPTTIICGMAKDSRSGANAYLVLYTTSDTKRNPADPTYFDIDQFRMKRIWPNPEHMFSALTPLQYAEKLLQIRQSAAHRIQKLNSDGKLFA